MDNIEIKDVLTRIVKLNEKMVDTLKLQDTAIKALQLRIEELEENKRNRELIF